MIRNVRPSWIELEVEGRKTDIQTGPRRSDQNMTARFYVRKNGISIRVLTIEFKSDGEKTEVVFSGDLLKLHNAVFHQ